MADEFAKGFGLLTGAGLVWMVLAGWYRTPGFEEAQLIGELPSDLTAFDQLAVTLMEGMFWLAIFGALFFWVGVPVGREVRARLQED
jgi:hypothetical protein